MPFVWFNSYYTVETLRAHYSYVRHSKPRLLNRGADILHFDKQFSNKIGELAAYPGYASTLSVHKRIRILKVRDVLLTYFANRAVKFGLAGATSNAAGKTHLMIILWWSSFHLYRDQSTETVGAAGFRFELCAFSRLCPTIAILDYPKINLYAIKPILVYSFPTARSIESLVLKSKSNAIWGNTPDL